MCAVRQVCAGYAERILASVGTLGGLGVGGSGVVQDASRSAVHPHLKTAFFLRGSGNYLLHDDELPLERCVHRHALLRGRGPGERLWGPVEFTYQLFKSRYILG